jgi:PAS domain S-box-containing protein
MNERHDIPEQDDSSTGSPSAADARSHKAEASPLTSPEALREQAERVVAEHAALAAEASEKLTPEAMQRLVHELQVHRIELEMQNEELRRAQVALDSVRARYFDLYDLAPLGYCTVGETGIIVEANLTAATLFGVRRGELLRRSFSRFIHQDDQDSYYLFRKQILAGRAPEQCELRMLKQDGTVFWARLAVTVARDGGGAVLLQLIISEITERKFLEEYMLMSRDVLQILNDTGTLEDSMRRVLAVLKDRTGFDAVGIRLQDGEDFPYFAESGFSADFLRTENSLLDRDAGGDVCRDSAGRPSLECTCGLVINGTTALDNPLFTPGGSFWTNDSPVLLGIPLEEDPRLNPRNKCIHSGYASVALVPIRSRDRIVGMIQLNDRRGGCFSAGRVALLEDLAAHIGEALLRLRAEESLRNREVRMRMLMQTIPDLIWLKDLEGVFLTCNPMFERFFGAKEADIVGKTDYDFVDRELADFFRENDRKAIAAGRPSSNEEWISMADDGRRVYLETIKSPVYDDDGSAFGVLGIGRDITKRKLTQDKLLESEARFRSYFEMPLHGIAIIHPDNGWIEVNERLCAIFGYSKDEIQSKTWMELTHPDDLAADVDQFNQLRAGAIAQYQMEKRYIRKDGRIIWASMAVGCVRETDGTMRYAIGILDDITERKRIEEALRESVEQHRSIFNASPDVLVITDLEGGILMVSPIAMAMFGYDAEEHLLGKRIQSFIAPEDVERAEVEFASMFQAVKPAPGQYCGLRSDGSRIDVEVNGEVIRDAEGQPVQLLFIIRDISERRRFESELLVAKMRAENSERLKDVFIANISHEIRTPLNIILGYTNVIEEKFLSRATDAEARYFESVQRGGERLLRTVDMILNVSRLQSGEYTLNPAEVDISGLVQKIVADHQPFAKKKQLSLSSIDECGSAHISVDEYCITQAVSNLLHNAIKFTISGGVQLRTFRDAGGRLCISCRDTGIGIAPDYLPLLFSRYSQEHTGYSRPFEGLGLGMALVKEYLAVNNATIDVVSEKGAGTTFAITFENGGIPAPARDASPADAPAHPSAEVALRAGPADRKRTVLLIEDDEMTVEFMTVVLSERWNVLTASSGPEAWAVLRAAHVDIILMDISLSGRQTGIELTQEIRQSPAHRIIPIIAVTAHAYASDRENCLDAGCDDFLRKPVSSRVLVETMERLLAR